MTLCVTWRFYIQKSRHLAKSKTICYTFYIKKTGSLRSAILHWIFEICWEGGGIYLCKKSTFAWHFNIKKKALWVTFASYKITDTMRYILISQKQCTFCYGYIYIIICLVLIPNYKQTYDQSDQIKKKFELFIENWSYSYDKWTIFDT